MLPRKPCSRAALSLRGRGARRVGAGVLLALAALVGSPGCAPFFSMGPPPAVDEAGVRQRIELPRELIDEGPSLSHVPEPMDGPPPAWSDDPRLTLAQAIDYGLTHSPRLRQAAASVGLALGRQQVAAAPYYPKGALEYRFVVTGSEATGFAGGDLPYVFGFGPGGQEFAQGELQLEWMLIDFGRRASELRYAALESDIAAQQRDRACQRVVYDVASAYYHALYQQAVRIVQQESVHRAEAILRDSRNLFQTGVTDRDSLLRAEVQLAASQEQLVAAQSAEAVSLAGLNLAMGRNVNSPVQLVARNEEPPFGVPLGVCLEWATDQRREVAIARAGVAAAQAQLSQAIADFRPKIFAKAAISRIDGSGVLSEDVQAAGLHVRQELFTGCARVGRRREASSAVAYATAQAQGIFDTIAFEVKQAYEAITSSRQRIVLSQTSIRKARENLQQVTNKYNVGDATPTDIVDAETTLTSAQQSYYRAMFDYRTALARMEYAIGAPLGPMTSPADAGAP